MHVKEVMTSAVRSCRPETDLAAAAMLMWDGDCGVLPVIDQANKVLGVITDRDICMAVATKHRPASATTVGEVLSGT
ncbi:MAG: CBS domain-containing protein, partial [Nitrospinota bacterium]